MARLYTGRYKVLSTYRSYHGGTATAVNMSGDPRRWLNDYGTAGTLHFWGPFLYRSAFHSATEAEECDRALEHLDQLIRFEGPETIAAIILEPVPGTSGVMVPPPGYMRGVRELCDRFGIVMIADEVMSGFGRVGAWFAISEQEAVPDLLTFAKGVNSGYIPLGGVAIGNKIAAYFNTHFFPLFTWKRDQPPRRSSHTFQNIRLFPALTAIENVKVGIETRHWSGPLSAMLGMPWQRREERESTRQALALLREVGLPGRANDLAGSLAYGEQRRLEIARALGTDPGALLLDEPAAGTNPAEKRDLAELISRINQTRNVSVLLIEHDMKLVMSIAHRIVVLNFGQKIAEGAPAEIQRDPVVVAAYLGTSADEAIAEIDDQPDLHTIDL
jgi:ABC-type branched-subunit amino acid transport system ATPase component